jgi:hypothetical protein
MRLFRQQGRGAAAWVTTRLAASVSGGNALAGLVKPVQARMAVDDSGTRDFTCAGIDHGDIADAHADAISDQAASIERLRR